MSELNREQIIKALKDMNMKGVSPVAIRNAIALIKQLTEENDAWQKLLISTEEKTGKAYYELACEVEKLRTENANLHASCTEFERKCASLNDENDRLRVELEQRPPRLVITKLQKGNPYENSKDTVAL
jgi:predicted nuclease with TOPRIM domain